jgi:hypothetical protein
MALGGAALALGVWLKLYPAVLAVFALRRRSWPALGGLAVAFVAVPLVLLPVVPLSLYREYAVEVLGSVAGVTVPATLNVGLPVVVERWWLPPEGLLSNTSVPAGAAASAVAAGALVAGVAASATAWARGWPTERAAFAVLATIPVASLFGWEYTFVLALPAVLALLVASRRRPVGVRMVAVATVGAWLVQKPPERAVAWAVAHLGEAVVEVFAARFVLSLAVLAACVLWTTPDGGGRRDRCQRPPAPSSRSA